MRVAVKENTRETGNGEEAFVAGLVFLKHRRCSAMTAAVPWIGLIRFDARGELECS